MMIVLLIAGICAVLAGLLAILFGIPVKEFSFGNTLILAGVVGVCSGIIVLAQALVVRELKNIARLLSSRTAAESLSGTVLAAGATEAADADGFLLPDDQGENAQPEAGPSAQAPPWREDVASRHRTRQEGLLPQPEPGDPPPGPKRRNVLFSSSVRRERDRPPGRAGEGAPSERDGPPQLEPGEPPPPSFDDAWPKPERPRAFDPPQRRAGRPPSAFTDGIASAPAADRAPPVSRGEDQSAVTVIKSGVVDGMAYSLYSDGSIEAQMPEGMMRFASIDELRAHLDQRL